MTKEIFSLDWPHGYVDSQGRPARIICKDALGNLSLVFLVTDDAIEFTYKTDKDGKNSCGTQFIFNAPKPKKKYTGWANCYYNDPLAEPLTMCVYATKELANRQAAPSRVACIEISFHEGDGL